MENDISNSEQTYKAIAIELMEEMRRGKDLKTIYSRDKILDIIEKIRGKGYYMVHQDLNNANQDAIKNFSENSGMIFKTLLKEIPEKLQFDIELFKFGKKINSLRKRWALITNDKFYSSNDKSYSKNKTKDKTDYLKNGLLKYETKNNQKDWSVPTKTHRIIIEFNDIKKKNKKDFIFLYFNNENELNLCKDKLATMRSGNDEVSIINNLKSMQKLIEGSYLFYGIIKLLEAKQKVKKRKVLLNSMKSLSNESFVTFGSFMKSVSYSWINKFKCTKKEHNVSGKSRHFPKYKTLYSNFHNNNDDKQFITINSLKNNLNIIVKKFSENLKNSRQFQKKDSKNMNKIDLLGNLNKSIAFKIQQSDVKIINKMPRSILTSFDKEKFKKIYNFTINKKKNEINFGENSFLCSEDLLNISNIFLNLNTNKEYDENYLTINGPKINSKEFLRYTYKNSYMSELSKEEFIEPDYHELAMIQSRQKNKSLYLQIFHCVFVFEKKDLKYLEIQNRENKYGNFIFENPMDDFLFFISFKINKNYKAFTKLVKAKKYQNDRLIIEFNFQHILNNDCLDLFNPFELKVSLNLIPTKCFDFSSNLDNNFYLSYLNPYELGFCIVNEEKINNRIFEFCLIKEGVNLPDENKILMNIFIQDECERNDKQCIDSNNHTKFFGKEFNVGNEIYALEELDKEFFTSRSIDNNIDPLNKEKKYNVKFSTDGSFLLRPPITKGELKSTNFNSEEEFTESFVYESHINPDDLKGIIMNRNFKFLPHCEKFIDSTEKSKSKNLSLYDDNGINGENIQIKTGNWIYKLQKLKKYFLGQFKGITVNRHFVYQNYFLNELRTTKITNVYYDIKKKYKPVQENLFGIYDFSEIDKSNLKNSDNYDWKIGMKFINKNELHAFVFFLKDLRRRANLLSKTKDVLIDKPIDFKVLISMNKNVKLNLKRLKILIDQIEFRQNYKLTEDKHVSVKISKTNGNQTSVSGRTKSMLESLDESDRYSYKNSLMLNNEVENDIKMLQNMKSDTKTLPKEYEFYANEFNSSVKKYKFGDKVNIDKKLFEIEAKPGFDKIYTIEIILKGKKKTETLTANINLEEIIKFNPQADLFYAPLFLQGTQTICGIINLKVWAVNPEKFENFEEVFDRCLNKFIKDKKSIDNYGNEVNLGKYEPNVYRRSVLRLIHSKFKTDLNNLIKKLDDKNNRESLHKILKKKCILYCDDLINENNFENVPPRWKDLIPDLNLRQQIMFKKFYLQKKRNEFYQIFSKCEWDLSTLIKINKDDKVITDKNNLSYNFPSKITIANWKKNYSDKYNEIRYLFSIGLPDAARLMIWERILDIQNLAFITREKLIKNNITLVDPSSSEENCKKLKSDIYNHYKQISENRFKFNINFSLIDNDLNYLNCGLENIRIIKNIARCFFLWSELDITTDIYVKGPSSETRKFVYFFGILKIIRKIFSVVKDESQTFWIIVGLSQIIELFYQTDPLYSSEMSYTKIYVLITKLIMESHLKQVHNKFSELGFPLEFFSAKLIPTMYCDIFNTELFLRLLDMIIFEAAFKTDIDRYDYLRLICTIPPTLLKLNEKKLMECKSVKEIERVFDDLLRKSFNTQKFMETIHDNLEKFYHVKNYLETLIEINTNTSWDLKRAKIENKLSIIFSKTQNENATFLKSIARNKSFQGIKIASLESEISSNLGSVRKGYSMGTPDLDYNDTNDVINFKHGISFVISNFYSFDSNFSINAPNKLISYFEYDKNIIKFKDFNLKSNSNSVIIQFNDKEIYSGFNVTSSNINRKEFQNNIPKYLNIFLLDVTKNSLIGQYALDILKLQLMRPYKIKLESIDEFNKTSIEICIFKYSLQHIKDDEAELFNLLFSEPKYLYDPKLETEINDVSSLSTLEISKINKLLNDYENNCLGKLNTSQYGKFSIDEFKRNYLKINFKSDLSKINDRLEIMLKNLFDKSSANKVSEWLSLNESSFEEILYALIIADPSTITIQEKLKQLFDVARMKNYLIYTSESITVDKLKELVYSIYKRFMVYSTRYEVDRLVDYILKGENFMNLKWVLLYDNKNSHKVEELVFDNDHVSTSVSSLFIKEKFSISIARKFVNLMSILKNEFNLSELSSDIINASNNYLTGNISVNEDKLRLDIDSDNSRKVKIYNLTKANSINSMFVEDHKIDEKFPFSGENNLFNDIIKHELLNIDLSTTNLCEISFDKFKDVFFSLPLISDLFRASCRFNYPDENDSESSNKYIRTLENVNIEVCYQGDSDIKNFVFTKNFDKNSYKNSQNVLNMNTILESSMNIQDILDILISKIQDKVNLYEDLQLFFENPQLTSYYVLNDLSGIEEKMKFYDPLYFNYYIRNLSHSKQLKIIFRLESTDEMTRTGQKVQFKKSGFSKFKNINISPYHEWRECKIKQDVNKTYAKFKCFDNPYYFKVSDQDFISEER